MTLFYIIIAFVIFDYAFSRFLEYLNSKHLNHELPNELKDIYDAEEYKKSIEYDKVNSRFGFITSTFSFMLTLLMFTLGGFAFVDNLARDLVTNPILISLVFFGILMFASDIVNIPFDLYDTFVIEERFGFNKTTVKTYIFDKLKSWLLGALLGGGIMALIIWFYMLTAQYFWLYAWIAVSGFLIFMTMFASNIIVPWFNKQTPLQEGDLRNAIQQFSNKVGFKLKNVFVIDGSKRSTKANAYFTGLGAKKRIVLYDTLINDLSIGEIVAVLAHEIGHYKKKHTLIGLFTGILQTGVILYIFSLFVGNPALSKALGSDIPSFHLAMVTFGILYSPFSMILGIMMNVVSRKNEYQADRFAKENFNGMDLIGALKKLSVKNLSNLTPHPLYVFFHYSHPTLLQRIKELRS